MAIKWNHNFKLKTYEPKKKLEIHKEEVLPHAFRLGSIIARIGGFFSVGFFFFIGLFKAFFVGKEKIREFKRKREKVIVFRAR